MQIWNQLALTIPKLHRPPLAIQICVCYVHLKTSVRIEFSVVFLRSVCVTVDTGHFDRENPPCKTPILPKSVTVITVRIFWPLSWFGARTCSFVSFSAVLLRHDENYRACVREKDKQWWALWETIRSFCSFSIHSWNKQTNRHMEQQIVWYNDYERHGWSGWTEKQCRSWRRVCVNKLYKMGLGKDKLWRLLCKQVILYYSTMTSIMPK